MRETDQEIGHRNKVALEKPINYNTSSTYLCAGRMEGKMLDGQTITQVAEEIKQINIAVFKKSKRYNSRPASKGKNKQTTFQFQTNQRPFYKQLESDATSKCVA